MDQSFLSFQIKLQVVIYLQWAIPVLPEYLTIIQNFIDIDVVVMTSHG